MYAPYNVVEGQWKQQHNRKHRESGGEFWRETKKESKLESVELTWTRIDCKIDDVVKKNIKQMLWKILENI